MGSPSSSVGATQPADSSAATDAMAPPGGTVPPTLGPAIVPTEPPTYPPDAFMDRPEWRISLDGATAKDQVVALIVDPERRVIGAAPASMRLFTIGFTGGVLPADSDHAVDVYWRSSVCGRWETVTLGPDGRITVNTTPSDTVCTPGPTMRRVGLPRRGRRPIWQPRMPGSSQVASSARCGGTAAAASSRLTSWSSAAPTAGSAGSTPRASSSWSTGSSRTGPRRCSSRGP